MAPDRQEKGRAALADFRNSIITYPSANDLATIEVPVVCTYGARSPDSMVRLVRSLAAAIPTAKTHRVEDGGHAAAFDATSNFVELIADTMTSNADLLRLTQ
jgi:pimeloyl-ACP methyl ester carboxylesterase